MPGNRQTELERHVESRGGWRLGIKLHTGEIMQGITPTPNQRRDSIQAPLSPRDFSSRPRYQTVGAHPRDVCQVEIVKMAMVGDIKKNVE